MQQINAEIQALLDDKYTKIHQIRKRIIELSEAENQNVETLFTLEKLKGRVEEIRKLYRNKDANFEPVLGGKLGLSARPSLVKVNEFGNKGVSTIITLLKKEEKGVEDLGKHIKSRNIDWIWFPMFASRLPKDPVFRANINQIYDEMAKKLNQEETILIHCAAGVHRTGAFTNGFLRKNGFSISESKRKIYDIRPVTAIEAVTKHWNWSERIIEENL